MLLQSHTAVTRIVIACQRRPATTHVRLQQLEDTIIEKLCFKISRKKHWFKFGLWDVIFTKVIEILRFYNKIE
jgi:hypothetical protein